MKDKKIDISEGYVFAPYILASTYPLDIPNFSSKVSISHRYVTTSYTYKWNTSQNRKIIKLTD
jgi:hypothetical protein